MRKIKRNDIGDIKKCSHEPIHLPGALQGFGTLVGFDRRGSSLAFYGSLFSKWFELSHEELKHCQWNQFSDWFDLSFNDEMWKRALESSSVLGEHFRFNNATWVAQMTSNNDYVFVEFERCSEASSSTSYFDGLSNFIHQSNSVAHFFDFSKVFVRQ